MTRKSTYLLFFILLTCTFMMAQVTYLQMHPQAQYKKTLWASLVGLPDLALASDAPYVRHRSLSSTFAFFTDSPELLEYAPSTFVYRYSPIVTRREREK